MRNIDWNNVEEAKEFKKVTPGGYVCGITAVEDVNTPNKNGKCDYLRIELDIAEGEYKNYFLELYKSKGFWGLEMVKSYQENSLPFFKGFLTAVENSNKGYKFNNDEKTLLRKYIGVVLREEEYRSKDGKIKTKLVVDQVHSIDKIRSGDFTVPELKKLDVKDSPATPTFDMSAFEDIPTPDDSNLPFGF